MRRTTTSFREQVVQDKGLADLLGIVRTGRFREALSLVTNPTSVFPPSFQSERRVLHAELLLHTGKHEEAKRTIEQLVKSRTDVTVRARCYLVLAGICLEREHPRKSIRYLQKAALLADETADMRTYCLVRLRLLTTLSTLSTSQSTLELARDVQRTIARYGDTQLASDFHIRMAQVEARFGSCDNARSHLDFARRLLDTDRNIWLLGALELSASAICYVRSDFTTAVDHGLAAVSLAESSGHARTRMAATANLGLLYLNLGDYGKAERLLNEALDGASSFVVDRISLLDSFAQLRMACGQWKEAQAILRDIERIASEHDSELTCWQQLAVCQTRTRLLNWMGQFREADIALSKAIGTADAKADKAFQHTFRVLQADALIGLGQSEKAAVVISEAERLCDVPTAELERVKGLLFTSIGQRSRAIPHMRRALRLARINGGLLSRMEMLRGSSVLCNCQAANSADIVPALEAGDPEQMWTPTSIAGTEAEKVEPVRAALSHAACLLQLNGQHELFAREVYDLLCDTGCVRAAALQRVSRRSIIEVLASYGWTKGEALQVSPNSTERISVAGLDATLYHVFFEPQTDPGSIEAIASVRHLVDVGLELERRRRLSTPAPVIPSIEDLPATTEGIFVSQQTLRLLMTAKQVATTNLPILITGETGTGKEMLARTIHQFSPRAGKSFVPFNCTGLPRELVESQLFGYRRGAFTGAYEHSPGVIRSAAGGTLLLDEIGEIDPPVQPKLLRFLETGEIQPIGEPRPFTVDVRIIAATNVDLADLVHRRLFRQDLYYRLNVVCLRIPPLRERREEIPPLVYHLIARHSRETGKQSRLAPDALGALLACDWPGNVRQLANEIRRLVALSEPNAVISRDQLSPEITAHQSAGNEETSTKQNGAHEIAVPIEQKLQPAVDQLERAMIEHALRTCHGGVSEAAKILGLSRKGLFLKRRRLGIDITATA